MNMFPNVVSSLVSVKTAVCFYFVFSTLFATCGLPVFFLLFLFKKKVGGGSCCLCEDTTSLGNKFWSRATDGSIETSLSQVSLFVQVANLGHVRQTEA